MPTLESPPPFDLEAPPQGDPFFLLRPEVQEIFRHNIYEALEGQTNGDLEQAISEGLAVYASAEHRENLFKDLIKNDEAMTRLKALYRERYPNLPEEEVADHVSESLNRLGELLEKDMEVAMTYVKAARQRMALTENVEEKKGILRWCWDKIKGFPKRHPVVTTLLVLAAAAGGMYLLWTYLGNIIPVPNPMEGAADVAEELAPATGGAFDAIPQGEIGLPNSELPVEGLQYPPNPSPTTVPLDIFANPAGPDIVPPPPSPPVGPNPDDFFRRGPL